MFQGLLAVHIFSIAMIEAYGFQISEADCGRKAIELVMYEDDKAEEKLRGLIQNLKMGG